MSAGKNFLILLSFLMLGVVVAIVGTLIIGDRSNAYKSSVDLEIDDIQITSEKLGEMFAGVEEDDTKLQTSTSQIVEFDGKPYMTISAFLSLTGDEINANNEFIHNEFNVPASNYVLNINGTQYVEFYSILESLGYTCAVNNDTYTLSRTFATKRLMVETDKKISINYNAISSVVSSDCVYLQYATERDAMYAYQALKIDYNVSVDSKFQCDNTADYSEYLTQNIEYQAQSISSSARHFNSWGGDVMGFYEYKSYLETVCSNLNDVTAVVIDSGINYNHPIFSGRLSPYCISFAPGQKKFQYNDQNGHGTHVAGTIAELTTSNVKILAIKVEDDDESIYASALNLAYKYVLQLVDKGVPIVVVNASYGCNSDGNVVAGLLHGYSHRKVNDIVGRGILFCAAAGNESGDASNHAPSNIEGVICVSAMDKNLDFASYSNFGDRIDFVAPGSQIQSANYKKNTICLKSGTSMATPHVSAAFALMASDSIKNYSSNEMKEVAKSIVVDIGEVGKDKYFGYGYIDLRGLVPSGQIKAQTKTCLIHAGLDIEDFVRVRPEIKMQYTNEYFIAQDITFYNFEETPYTVDAVGSIKFVVVSSVYNYEILGWYVGEYIGSDMNYYDLSTPTYLGDILNFTDYSDGDEIYVIVKCRLCTVDCVITLNFIDSPEYDGYFGYGVNLSVGLTSYYKIIDGEPVLQHDEAFDFVSTPRMHTWQIDDVVPNFISLYFVFDNESQNSVSVVYFNGYPYGLTQDFSDKFYLSINPSAYDNRCTIVVDILY